MLEDEVSENIEVQIKGVVKDRRRKLTSTIWQNFTVLDKEQKLASCDLCGVTMSYKSTVTNIRKHLVRKHNLNDRKDTFFRPGTFKVSKESTERIINIPKKKTLTELSGIEGLLLNVVGEDGDPIGEEESAQDDVVEESVLYTTDGEGHDYCTVDNEQSDHPGDSIHKEMRSVKPKIYDVHSQARFKDVAMTEKVKKNRIMDLQLECLEIKKYTMQMEALVLEHQLNLPRSVYTEPFQKTSSMTRGTQTDIGGNNTKVFYVSDTEGPKQHFFSFQARTDE